MGYENSKEKRAKAKGFGKQAYIAKYYCGRPSEEAKKNFARAPYALKKGCQ